MANFYKNYEYSYAIAVCCYGSISGWVRGSEYDKIEDAFDALQEIQEAEPLEAKYGQHYRIELKYKEVKDEIKA